MGDGIIIWSRKPVHQRKTLFNCLEAAYESRLRFFVYGYSQYEFDGKVDYTPYSFTLSKDVPNNRPMIFSFSEYEEQKYGIEKWIDTRFVNNNRDEVFEHELYRLAVSEDIDSEMTFHFSFHYLKINHDQFITMADYIINWDLMKEIYPNGFKEIWY